MARGNAAVQNGRQGHAHFDLHPLFIYLFPSFFLATNLAINLDLDFDFRFVCRSISVAADYNQLPRPLN